MILSGWYLKSIVFAALWTGMVISIRIPNAHQVREPNLDLCAKYSDSIGFEFCSQTVAPKSMSNLKMYTESREKCIWQPFSGDKAYYIWDGVQWLNRIDRTSMINVQACESIYDDDETLFIHKIGPFSSNGGEMSWHRFLMDGIAVHLAGQVLRMSGYSQAPVKENGDFLGRPPIHIHHNHLTDDQCDMVMMDPVWSTHFASFLWRRDQSKKKLRPSSVILADTHGDRQCKEREGGVSCLIKRSPKGYAVPMQFRQYGGCNIADYVDMRPNNSSPLFFWVENAFMLVKEMKYAYGRGTLVDFYPTDGLTPEGFYGGRDAYDFDASTAGIAWRSFEMPFAGKVLFTHMHSHQLFTEDIWVVRANPVDLLLPEMGLIDHKNYMLSDLTRTSLGLEGYRQKLRNRVSSLEGLGKADVLCKRRADVYEYVEYPSDPRMNAYYERFDPPPCNSWTFLKGDVVTIISFHRSLFKQSENLGKIAMHTVVYLDYIPADLPTNLSQMALINVSAMNVNLNPFTRELVR